MRHAIIAVLAALLLASTASAEEVLFCADEGATGFVWDHKGNVQSTEFIKRRHTIRVVSESERWISKQGFSPIKYTCTNEKGLYFCRDAFWRLFLTTFFAISHTIILLCRASP